MNTDAIRLADFSVQLAVRQRPGGLWSALLDSPPGMGLKVVEKRRVN